VDWQVQSANFSLLAFQSSTLKRDPNHFDYKALRRRILLSSCRDAVDDRYADQTENTYSDPFLGHVQQVGADRQADDEYDVADDVNPE
jgi:hypothetical protein